MLDGLLRVLDCIKGIKPANPQDPPPPPGGWRGSLSSPQTVALYEDLGQEMRALRATEFSVATLFYAVASFLVAANFAALAAEALPNSVKVGCVSTTIVFLLFLWSHVHGRISHDNHSYSHLLSRRRYIERSWFWPDMPGKPVNTATGASGPGYRMTQQMLALSVVFVVFVLALTLALMLAQENETADRTTEKATISTEARNETKAQGEVPTPKASQPTAVSSPASTATQ